MGEGRGAKPACRPVDTEKIAEPENKKPPGVNRRAGKEREEGYFFVLRLNFEVNFSTRPAVSTRRFSPV
jgi:hypothetical protein